MEKRKRIKTQLPEAMIHQIQSFLTAREAARTTLVSKSWYNAWLTRPTLAFNQRDFVKYGLNLRSMPAKFSKYMVETIQRYQDLNLKIECLQLEAHCRIMSNLLTIHKLIVDAMKMGATNLDLKIPCTFVLPPEVLGSETLLRLSASWCDIDGNVNCKMLKSLRLNDVHLKSDDMIRNIISCCNLIEELWLSSNSKLTKLALTVNNLHKLPNLKSLYLEKVDVDNSLFSDFHSWFPCLKDLSLVHCQGYKRIRIVSSSLQRISIVQPKALKGEFIVANLAVFRFSGYLGVGKPSVYIKARDGWESQIYMERNHFETSSWYKGLQALLTQLSPSRINLTIRIPVIQRHRKRIVEVDDVQVVGEPVAVENMNFEASYNEGHALVGLFCICRTKFLTDNWLGRDYWKLDNHSLKNIYHEQLMSKQNMFDLKEANVEVYEEDIAEWRPLLLQDALKASPKKQYARKIRFHLKW